jgi:hypothetical protein
MGGLKEARTRRGAEVQGPDCPYNNTVHYLVGWSLGRLVAVGQLVTVSGRLIGSSSVSWVIGRLGCRLVCSMRSRAAGAAGNPILLFDC